MCLIVFAHRTSAKWDVMEFCEEHLEYLEEHLVGTWSANNFVERKCPAKIIIHKLPETQQ